MTWLAVAIGGALGAMSRYGLSLWLAPSGNGFPWSTWVVNVLGSALIGLCFVMIVERGIIAEYWRPLFMVGFLGALTTFSAFTIEALVLWQQGQTQTSIVYIISSVAACLIAAASTLWLAQKIF